jgi:hypothetical protein
VSRDSEILVGVKRRSGCNGPNFIHTSSSSYKKGNSDFDPAVCNNRPTRSENKTQIVQYGDSDSLTTPSDTFQMQ